MFGSGIDGGGLLQRPQIVDYSLRGMQLEGTFGHA
jgi:hypothetical protein